MTNATPAQETPATAYRRGWQASKRSTTADLDAASDRYVKKYGRAQLRAFVAGWSDYAADADYNPPTDETVIADETVDDTISPADMVTGAWARTIDATAPHDDEAEPTDTEGDMDHPALYCAACDAPRGVMRLEIGTQTATGVCGHVWQLEEPTETVRYGIGWAVPYAVQQLTGEGRIEIAATFATISDALRAAADMLDRYEVPIGYAFDVIETTQED